MYEITADKFAADAYATTLSPCVKITFSVSNVKVSPAGIGSWFTIMLPGPALVALGTICNVNVIVLAVGAPALNWFVLQKIKVVIAVLPVLE
jgi:hypothetical protein